MRFPNIWQIFVREGGNSCLRHFRGAAKTANLLRGLSLMRKSCARSFATTKPRKKAPEGAAARGEAKKQKETDERRQGAAAAGQGGRVRDTRESLPSGGGSSTSAGSRDARERSEPRAWVTALDLARARGPTKRRALFSKCFSKSFSEGLKLFGPVVVSRQAFTSSSFPAGATRGEGLEVRGGRRTRACRVPSGNVVAWIGEHSVLVLSRLLFPGGSFFFFFWVSRG